MMLSLTSIEQWMPAILLQQNRNRKCRSASCVFQPFITFVDAALDCEVNVILKRIGERCSLSGINHIWRQWGWIQARLSFFLVCTTDSCLKGTRVKWRSSIGMEDGAGLPLLEL